MVDVELLYDLEDISQCVFAHKQIVECRNERIEVVFGLDQVYDIRTVSPATVRDETVVLPLLGFGGIEYSLEFLLRFFIIEIFPFRIPGMTVVADAVFIKRYIWKIIWENASGTSHQ